MQVRFYCFNCFTCSLYLVLTMSSMYGTLRANWSITVKTKIWQLLLRMCLAHIKWFMWFLYDDIVVRARCIRGLRNRSIGLIRYLIIILRWGVGIVFGLCFYFNFTVSTTCLVISISISYGTLTLAVIISLLALN